MFTCERCGAELPPNTDQCAYCGTVSAPARALLQAETARQQQANAQATAQAAIQRQLARVAIEQAASRALLWGLFSPIFFCLPFPSALALMAFNRAQRAARQAALELPTRAKVGLALGVLSGLGCVVFWIYIAIDMHADNVRIEARKAELGQVVTRHASSAALDHELACALAEISLLTDGFDGSTNTGSFRDLECEGALHVVKDRAELDDFKLRTSSSSSAVTATICFKHGDRWFVERTGHTSCELGN
jgi:multidrug efflux pump subunit AcrA (membrane-fusion protein)